VGVQGEIYQNLAGTITSASHYKTVVYNPSGTITNRYGFYCGDTAGTTTNQFGLYLENLDGATNNFAIYSLGGNSYHVGNFGIGTAAPIARMDIRGTLTHASGTTPRGLNLDAVAAPASAPAAGTAFLGAYYFINASGANLNTNSSVIAFQSEAQTDAGLASNVASVTGFTGAAKHRGSGTLTQLAAMGVGLTITGTGNVTSGYGLQVSAPVRTSTGVIVTNYGSRIYNQGLSGTTTSYGLYLDAQSGSTNNYSIYSAGGDSYHAGVWQAGGYKSSDGSAGVTGSFTTADSKTVTVKNGLITAIV
jgi:hypothetical protein